LQRLFTQLDDSISKIKSMGSSEDFFQSKFENALFSRGSSQYHTNMMKDNIFNEKLAKPANFDTLRLITGHQNHGFDIT
jgi:hypothetical protein